MPKPISTELPETKVTPDPELEKRTRRTHSPEYKLKIINEADHCKHGQLGALLRREGLYSNQLQQWRQEFATNGVAGLTKSHPGPVARLTPEQREIERLKKLNTRLARELEIVQGCLDLQKKALAMLDLTNSGKDQ